MSIPVNYGPMTEIQMQLDEVAPLVSRKCQKMASWSSGALEDRL
jgi:hypothetical protein